MHSFEKTIYNSKTRRYPNGLLKGVGPYFIHIINSSPRTIADCIPSEETCGRISMSRIFSHWNGKSGMPILWYLSLPDWKVLLRALNPTYHRLLSPGLSKLPWQWMRLPGREFQRHTASGWKLSVCWELSDVSPGKLIGGLKQCVAVYVCTCECVCLFIQIWVRFWWMTLYIKMTLGNRD